MIEHINITNKIPICGLNAGDSFMTLIILNYSKIRAYLAKHLPLSFVIEASNLIQNMHTDTIDNLQMIEESAKTFAHQHILPHVMEWDEAQYFPVETMRALGDLGFMGVFVPEVYGGSGLGYHEYVSVIVEVAKVCGSIGLSLAAHNSLCTGHILSFGNEEQKHKYLPKLASGEWIGAWGLTEANTGSDAMRMKCVAVQDGDDWVINGSKNWITHGKSGDVAVVLARTGELLDSHGITAFVVERGTLGFSGGRKQIGYARIRNCRDDI